MTIYVMNETCGIDEVCLGDCFRHDGKLYIRTEIKKDEYKKTPIGVNLLTGMLVIFENDAQVEPVLNAQVRIEG